MTEKWDKQQLLQFLKRTGEEFKRTGEELRTEAQRVIEEVRDPSRQAKLRENLEELKQWARTAGKEAAELLENAVHRVEQHFERRKSNPVAPFPFPTEEETEEAPSPAPRKKPARKASAKAPKKAAPKAKAPAAAKAKKKTKSP